MPSPPSSALMPGGSLTLSGESEHRQVTVLMADLAGYTAFAERAGEEAAYSLMGHIAPLMTTAIHQHRGTVQHFAGDGMMALFGAPVALEDGPLRACRAALQIQESVADASSRIEAELDIRPKLRIGVTTGPVVLGAVDSGESSSVSAYGDIVNVAARLQAEAAPGTVVMSEAMLRQVEGVVEVENLGVFRLKGKTKPQPAYRLVAIRERATRFDAAVARGLTSFVGRTYELEVLENQLQHLETVHVIDIVGEPGIGKSRLLYEFALRHGAEQISILRGSCSADGQATPFRPLIEVVRGMFSVSSDEADASIIGKLTVELSRLGHASHQNLGLLLNLLGRPAPEGALAGLDGTLIGARTRDLLWQLIETESRRSAVILLLEDMHWIDSASEELLSRIAGARKPLPLLILHTRRPEYIPPWADLPCVTELRMAPLSSSEMLRIAQTRFGIDVLPVSLARLIVQKAEGNALFVEEITSFLIERGTVRLTPSGLAYDADSPSTELPMTVQSLLTSRVDRLTPKDRSLLQIAAVIGRQFNPKLLAEVAGDSPYDVEQRLLALETMDLVQREARSQDFIFKHVLVRDALYDSLVSSRRAELHLEVASVIELRSSTRINEVVEMLAHHFSATFRHDKAFQYFLLSGQKCLDIYSLEEAELNFRNALALLRKAPECVEHQAIATVASNLFEVLYLKGDLLGLGDATERYIPQLREFGDSPQLVFALYFHTMLLAHRCEFRAAEAQANIAFDIAQRVGNIRAQAYARSALLFCSTVLGVYSLEAAEAEGTRVLETCTRAGDNYILNWGYWTIAWDYVCRGLTKKARVWMERLIDAGQERQDNRALGLAYWTLAWIDMLDGRYRDAVANAQKCLNAAATPFDRTAGTLATATGLLLEGRVDEGLIQLLTLKKWALANDWLYSASGVDHVAGPALAATGHITEGIRTLKTAIAACVASGSRAMASWNRLALAEILLRMLAAKEAPSLRFVLANLFPILRVRLFGLRQVRLLLDAASENDQFHESGITRCRIEIDFAKLYCQLKQPDLARAHLQKARLAATAQDSKPKLDEISELLVSLQQRAKR